MRSIALESTGGADCRSLPPVDQRFYKINNWKAASPGFADDCVGDSDGNLHSRQFLSPRFIGTAETVGTGQSKIEASAHAPCPYSPGTIGLIHV